MSVLIKGMKMPPSCYFCGLADTSFIHCEAFNPQKLLEEDCEERRPDWCPLVDLIECQECKYAHLTYNGEVKYCDVWFDEDPVYADGDYYCGSGERK